MRKFINIVEGSVPEMTKIQEALSPKHLGPLKIDGVIYTDDDAESYEFDAMPWFEQASDEELLDVIQHDFSSYLIGDWMASNDKEAHAVYLYAARVNENTNTEIDGVAAKEWIKVNRAYLLSH